MAYKFVFSKAGAEDLDGLDTVIVKRILQKLRWFEQQPNPLLFAKVLQGSRVGNRRFRVGDYRLIVVLDESVKLMVIARIGHRSDVYR